MRDDAVAASRPQLGRKPAQPAASVAVPDPVPVSSQNNMAAEGRANVNKQNNRQPAKIQTEVYTKEMWDKWTPDLLGIPDPVARRNPPRSSRNPSPYYVESIVNCSDLNSYK